MADEQNPDVTGDSSIAADAEAQAAAGAVTTGGADAEDKDAQGVPWKNRMAELERRHEKQLQEMQQMFQSQVAALQQAAVSPAQARQSQPQYTDEELLALGNQGHAAAMREYVQRQIQQQNTVQQRMGLAEQHAAALRQMYPDFNNKQSPLYQAANALYSQYLMAGEPATAQTQAMAMGTAAAAYARQQAQQQGVGQAAEATRQQQLEAHQSVGGSSVPPAGSNRRRGSGPTPEQVELAKKIGVKDPAKALSNFQKRAAEGRSSYGAGLSAAAERMLP